MTKALRMVTISSTLSLIPLCASEVGLLFDKQFGSRQTIGITYPLGPGNGPGLLNTQEAVKPSGMGIRGSYTLLNLWAAEMGITANYHPKASGDFTQTNYSNLSEKFGEFSTEYLAIGAQLDWNLLVNLHAGLDLRREKLSTEIGPSLATGSTTYTRPWICVGLGFNIPSPVVKPLVRLEAAYALIHADLGSNWDMNDLRKSMAPKYQVGIYVGINF